MGYCIAVVEGVKFKDNRKLRTEIFFLLRQLRMLKEVIIA